MNKEGSVIAYAKENLQSGENTEYWKAFLDGAVAQLDACQYYRKEQATLSFSVDDIEDIENMLRLGATAKEICTKYRTNIKILHHLFPNADFTFRWINSKQCIYEGLRKYLNENKYTLTWLSGKIQYSYDSARSMLNGDQKPTVRFIQSVYFITGIEIKTNDWEKWYELSRQNNGI